MKKYIICTCIFAAAVSWCEERSIVDILVERGLRTEEDAIEDGSPIIDPDGARELVEAVKVTKYPSFSIGPGMHVFTSNLRSGSVGYLNAYSPVQVSYRWRQFGFILWKEDTDSDKWVGTVHRFEIGPSLGFMVNASNVNHDFSGSIGLSVSPLTVSYKNVSIGLGVSYTTSKEFDLTNTRDWSFCIPVSYNFSFNERKGFQTRKVQREKDS